MRLEPKFCPRCGAVSEPEAQICKPCGYDFRTPAFRLEEPARPTSPTSRHKPSVAFILSAVFPGCGQIYNRQLFKGVSLILVFAIATFTVPIDVNWLLGHLPIVGILVILGSASVYDAYNIAVKLRDGQTVGAWECF